MRGILLGITSLLLVGCSTTPGIEVRTVKVPVLSVEKCIQKKDIPAKPSDLEEMPFNLEVVARLALAKVAEWQAYGNKVDPVLKGCAG